VSLPFRLRTSGIGRATALTLAPQMMMKVDAGELCNRVATPEPTWERRGVNSGTEMPKAGLELTQ